MLVYQLGRDDGAQLRLRANAWETALELAFLHGWKPAGTEPPDTAHDSRVPSDSLAWDGQDYFTCGAQRVGREDALCLARAVVRALQHIPCRTSPLDEPADLGARGGSASLLPTRASTLSDGLCATHRSAIRRLVAFASGGGFTIGGA